MVHAFIKRVNNMACESMGMRWAASVQLRQRVSKWLFDEHMFHVHHISWNSMRYGGTNISHIWRKTTLWAHTRCSISIINTKICTNHSLHINPHPPIRSDKRRPTFHKVIFSLIHSFSHVPSFLLSQLFVIFSSGWSMISEMCVWQKLLESNLYSILHYNMIILTSTTTHHYFLSCSLFRSETDIARIVYSFNTATALLLHHHHHPFAWWWCVRAQQGQ